MGLPETRLGIIPSFWFQHNFGAVMNSRRRAEYAVLAGKLFNSQECLEEGLVDCLVDTKEEAVEKCREVLGNFYSMCCCRETC